MSDIAIAVQHGPIVRVYDEKGIPLASISSSDRPNEGLLGFTSNTVTIKRNGVITVYNEKGVPINSFSAP
jgi:hypothetical protein